jgi:DNA-binding transcriptional MerR regulator
MFRITTLARQFGLSRSTLLYYDRIGLLSPTARSEAGYRLYSTADRARLETISGYRQAGLSIEDIQRILETPEDPNSALFHHRLKELGEEIRALQTKQNVLAGMLRAFTSDEMPAIVDKEAWVEMLRAAGMDEAAMARWHTEFERRAPQAHHEFLLSLGIPEEEALGIREWSAKR